MLLKTAVLFLVLYMDVMSVEGMADWQGGLWGG